MNISDSELDLVSLASRIEQIEEEQNLRKQNIAWLKRYFDEIKQEFNNRTELQQIQSMQEAIAHLTAQVAELQQHLNLSSNLSNGLNNNHTIDTSIKETIIDDTEIVKQFFEGVEKPEKQLACIDVIAIYENIDIAETESDEQINLAEEQPQLERAFSAQEFQIERIMWLLNRIYGAEEPIQEIPVDAEEFWRRYDGGERDFTGINLAGVNFSGKTFNKINLSKANLSRSNLSRTNLSNENLSGANLKGADMSEADLSGANLTGANLDSAYLHKTKLSSAKLEKATLKKANLSKADLSRANLTSTNLRGAGLYLANLEKANLQDADLSGANLDGAKLAGAIMPDGSTHE